MSLKKLEIEPFAKEEQVIELGDDVAARYGLDAWAADFSLMTAGYRDQLNPDDAADPGVAFNTVRLAILGEAKARVFKRKGGPGQELHVHVGGETRPHTQEFIAILARLYAAHDMQVHLRADVKTTPIWYSSFGVFYHEYDSGDNLTASHSPFFKGGWKPMDSSGKQLLAEEDEIIAEVKTIVGKRERIRLAPWGSEKIAGDFDIDVPYVNYQRSVLADRVKDEIDQAAAGGFGCSVCTVGGSMKATTQRLFPMLGVATGPGAPVQYIFGEEDSRYHQIGQVDGENVGPDPSKEQVYKHIGAQDILLGNRAEVVFIWDPDGDRFNIVTAAPVDLSARAAALGLAVDRLAGVDKALVYFTPNQLFFMLTAYRIEALKDAGELDTRDWFIAPSISTSRSIGEVAAAFGLPVVYTRVGFKYMGSLCEWLEARVDANEPFVNAIGERVRLGAQARALIMCEESGGAVFGGAELLSSKSGARQMIALREKDGMQFALMVLGLAARLYNAKRSFADYYCSLIEEHDIGNRFYNRRDVRLYDESLTGTARQTAVAAGTSARDAVMAFFTGLAEQAARGQSMASIAGEMNSRVAAGDRPLPTPKSVCVVGEGKLLEGTFMDFDQFWFLIRASGTDALLRYYIEGRDRSDIEAFGQSLINLRV